MCLRGGVRAGDDVSKNIPVSVAVSMNGLHIQTGLCINAFHIQSLLKYLRIPFCAAERCTLVSKVKTNLGADIPRSFSVLTRRLTNGPDEMQTCKLLLEEMERPLRSKWHR